MAVYVSVNTKEYPMSCYLRNIAITAIIAIVVLSGCASTSMNPVGGDRSIKEPGVNSVAFWNIQLIDLTGTMATDSRYCTPGMRLRERGVDNYGSVIRAEPVAGTGDKPVWKKEDGFTVYDALMSVSMEEGDFVMEWITVYPGYDRSGNTSLAIPVERRFLMKAGQLVNIGTIQVIFSEKFGNSYQYTVNYTRELVEPISNRFLKSFPGLCSSYDGDIGTGAAYYILEENFYSGSNPFPDDAHNQNVHMYRIFSETDKDWINIIERSSDDGSYDFITLSEASPLNASMSFSASWEGLWYNGDESQPYGLLLGRDSNNALYFGGSGNRQAAVFRMSGGQWDENLLDWTVLPPGPDTGEGPVKSLYLVEVDRRNVRYSVDGTVVAEFPLGMKFDSLFLGFYVSGKQSAGFNNLLIEENPGD